MKRMLMLGLLALTASPVAAQAPASPTTAAVPAAAPAPAADAARLWQGTLVYRVRMGADSSGSDTAVVRVLQNELVASDHMHLPVLDAAVETHLSLPALAPLWTRDQRRAGPGVVRAQVRYGAGRATGSVVNGADSSAVDAEVPAGAYDLASLGAVLQALPLQAGAVWTLSAYSPYVRAAVPLRIEVGEVETVASALGAVRAWPMRVLGSQVEMRYWFSEAEPRWEVKGEIPAYGISIEVQSRTP